MAASSTPKAATKTQKSFEAAGAIGLGGGVGLLAVRFWPELTPTEVAFISSAGATLVASGASFLRRLANAYDLKFLKVLLGIALVLPLVGCASVTPDGRIRTSGDSNQDTVIIKGPCAIEMGDAGSWSILCEDGGSATWTMAESANATLYVDLVKAGVEAAAAGASPAP